MGRKLALRQGQAVARTGQRHLPHGVGLKSADDAWLHTIGEGWSGLAAVQSATGWLIERRGHAQPDALAGATRICSFWATWLAAGCCQGRPGRLAKDRRRRRTGGLLA